jgi:hypothetical protein
MSSVEFAVHQLAQALQTLLVIPDPRKMQMICDLHLRVMLDWDEELSDTAGRVVEILIEKL